MPTNKQRREAARRKLERQLQARVAREKRRHRTIAVLTGVGAVVLIAAVVTFIVATNNDSKNSASSSSSSSSRAALPSRKITAIPARAPKKTTGPCKYAETTALLTGGHAYDVGVPPDPKKTPKKAYTVDFNTNQGQVTVQLNGAEAPCNVQSLVYLIGKKFYDSTACSRLVTSGIFVLQCGDPSATGAGGPTYQTKDENLSKAKYTTGMIAMANSGKNTNGSQFFIVTKNSTTLPKNYTVIGKVTKGMDLIQKVAAKGSDNSTGDGDGRPNLDMIFKTVRLVKSEA
ncbi:MAG TPA: peptidylprolyl isomerase [Jatrophihabitantaceae bacterium]|nr:peptidylprolyl isomerase [Jatrophihabitantaceae bacterium]